MSIIAKYKFDKTIYADLLPGFNAEFTSDLYIVTDEVDSENSNHIIRTIESESLPTLMTFGSNLSTYVEGNEIALLEVLDMNTSGLTSCYRMFRYCKNLTSITCEWDTSNVTNMYAMFWSCTNLTSLDVSNFDTSKVTTMGYMFYDCKSLTSLDVSNFNTSNVTDMYSMFRDCTNLTSLDVSNWNTSNVTSMLSMFRDCNNLTSLDVSNWNTSNVTNMSSMFSTCSNLTSLDLSSFRLDKCTTMLDMFAYCHNIETIILPDEFCTTGAVTNIQGVFYQNYELKEINISNWNTSNVTNMNGVFAGCNKLTSLDVSNWNTNNVIYTDNMFYECNNLTSLDVSNFNTSNVTSMGYMFHCCNNLTSLDVSNFNTSKVTNMQQMFYGCNNLTSLDVSNFDTSNVIYMSGMFYSCNNLTTLDLSNWNTSNVTNMSNMFDCCTSLTEIHGIFNWDTSNVANMCATFGKCESLIELNLSGWDTSSVTNADNLFGQCFSLVTLDISNFKFLTNCNTHNIFNEAIGNIPLTDIGMLYCDQSTINKVASSLPTDTTQTIWVEDVDVKDLTPVEGVEFKQYTKNTEIMLTSPLLEGDKIEVIDGKTYHYHKMGMVVFDGSEDESWTSDNAVTGDLCTRFKITPPNMSSGTNAVVSDKFITRVGDHTDTEYIFTGSITLSINILNTKLSTTEDVNGFKQWLQANPTTVVYQLATPYYELISEDPLDISLIAESSDITNSSNIPLNMIINNKGLATIAMSPSTTYTVAFDKDTDSEVVVNLCGNEVTTTDNIVEITTPSEIDDELIFYGNDVEISNVRLLEGSLNEDSVPRESFKGLKNSFEDGCIPTDKDNILHGKLNEFYSGEIILTNNLIINSNIKASTVYTVVIKDSTNKVTNNTISTGNGSIIWKVYDNRKIYTFTTPSTANGQPRLYLYSDNTNPFVSEDLNKIETLILEGDWTHLSEEDFNHLGKYKVEYKVTGKNKYPTDSIDNPDLLWEDSGGGTAPILYSSDEQAFYTESHRQRCFFNLKPNTPYTVSVDIKRDENNTNYYDFLFQNYAENISYPDGLTTEWVRHSITRTTDENGFLNWVAYRYCYWKNIQIEEGTVATEYEPYKEYTKTFYLNSPLLEGDTIEDVNGVATHVKRYKKIVLDGSENWSVGGSGISSMARFCLSRTTLNNYASETGITTVICDKFASSDGYGITSPRVWISSIAESSEGDLNITKELGDTITSNNDVISFKQWLSQNPVTVVYELASPKYEKISTESILCDSYVNGHLDFGTNVPIEKVEFGYVPIKNVYLIPETNYTIQFESDNVGKLDCIVLGGYNKLSNIDVVKGLNRIKFYTVDDVGYSYIDLYGIGFNASNIQVVATDRDVDSGYFKGLQSSFESELVTDEADENYGKYKVECKVIGKNKFDINEVINKISSSSYELNNNELTLKSAGCVNIPFLEGKFKENTQYMFSYNFSNSAVTNFFIAIVYTDGTDQPFYTQNTGKINRTSLEGKTIKHLVFSYGTKGETTLSNIQIEEGITPTPYEPYQEYTKTIYLNSPLLKGDTIEVHNGKLCHYHKMGMVVLDGSEDEGWWRHNLTDDEFHNDVLVLACSHFPGIKSFSELTCDKFKHIFSNTLEECIYLSDITPVFTIKRDKLNGSTDLEDFKEWLQANPTTIVYELAEPYYEEISPLQEDLIITSVKEGDLHIDTIVPISSKVTYNVNVQLLTDFEQSIVEQVQATQTTDLQSILDEEIDN